MDWKFYIYKQSVPSVIYASHLYAGFSFTKDGLANTKKETPSYRRECTNHLKEINLVEALSYINKSGHANFLKTLNITPPDLKPISPETTAFIVKVLNENRANNGDSAYDFKGENYNDLYQLKEKGIIGEIQGRYYLKENG